MKVQASTRFCQCCVGMPHVHRKKLIEALEQNDKDAIASFQTDQRGANPTEQGASAGRDLTLRGNFHPAARQSFLW